MTTVASQTSPPRGIRNHHGTAPRKPNSRCLGKLRSLRQCNCPEGLGHDKTENPNEYFQKENPTNFQIQVATGPLEKPLATMTVKFENGGNFFAEFFVVLKKTTGLILRLQFMRNNSDIIDTTHGLIQIRHLRMQTRNASSETAAKRQHVITDDALTIPPSTTKTITTFVDLRSEWKSTRTITPLEKIKATASLLIFHSMLTINDKRIAARITKKNGITIFTKKTQSAEFSVVTPEQSKCIKRVEIPILNMIPPGNPDLTA